MTAWSADPARAAARLTCRPCHARCVETNFLKSKTAFCRSNTPGMDPFPCFLASVSARHCIVIDLRTRSGAKKKPAYPCGRSLGHPWPWGFREKGNKLSIDCGIGTAGDWFQKCSLIETHNSKVASIDLSGRNDSGGILGDRFAATDVGWAASAAIKRTIDVCSGTATLATHPRP